MVTYSLVELLANYSMQHDTIIIQAYILIVVYFSEVLISHPVFMCSPGSNTVMKAVAVSVLMKWLDTVQVYSPLYSRVRLFDDGNCR